MPPLSAEETVCAKEFVLQAHKSHALGKEFGVVLARERGFVTLAYDEDGLAEEKKKRFAAR